MKIQQYAAARIRIDQIKSSRLQPPNRTAPSALKRLEAAIARTGLIVPILVRREDDGTYTMIDGHRRAIIASAAGERLISAIIVPFGEEEGIGIVGPGIKTFGTEAMFYAWSQSEEPEKFLSLLNIGVVNNIRAAVRIFGEKDARLLAASGATLTFVSRSYTVKSFLNQWGENGAGDEELVDLKTIACWILKHNMCSTVGGIKQFGTRTIAVRLRKCILADLPFELPKHRRGPSAVTAKTCTT